MSDGVTEYIPREELARGRRQGRAALDPAKLDRLPPHSIEAEQGVLGCILWNPQESLAVCEDRFGATEWAYDLRHQAIYDVMRGLHAKLRPVDLIAVQQALADAQLLERVGGIAYLSSLQDMVPSAANLGYYLDIVLEKYRMRMTVRICSDLVARAYEAEGQEVLTVLDEAVRDLEMVALGNETQRERPIKELVKSAINQLEQYHRGKAQLRGLPTGLEYLDKVLQGIDKTHYVVIAGRPGDGKTSLAMNIVEKLALDHVWWEQVDQAAADAASAAGQRTSKNEAGEYFIERVGIPVGIFSLEMDGESLVTRMMFGRGGADMGTWNTGMASAADFQKLTRGAGELVRGKIWIDDLSDQTIGKIRSRARRMVREHGIKLFVLDYIQLLDTDDEKLRNDRVRELTKISKALVSLKKQLKVPWLVLAQMNRNIEQAEAKRVPVLSDLKDCGALEQDADKVIFLYKPSLNEREENEALLDAEFGDDWSKRPALVNAYVAKNRFGPTGKAEMLFWKNMNRFQDLREWKVKSGKVEAAKGERYAEPKRVTAAELPTDEELAM